jgi:hypothetical protein
MTAKKQVPAAPELDADALVPERPKSKVEAGLAAVESNISVESSDEPATPSTKTSASKQGQAMLAEDAEATEQLINEEADRRAVRALVKLGVPEDVARLAVAGDLDAARAAADGVTAAPAGELCGLGCFTGGWDALPFDAVSCVHGSWKR